MLSVSALGLLYYITSTLYIFLLRNNSDFIKKEALAQVFSCEFCEISKNTFFYRTPPVAASDNSLFR